MRPELYPRPISFYQHPAFEGERGRIIEPDANLSRLRLFGIDKAGQARILSQLAVVKYQRLGRLRGEYLLDRRCLTAFDQHGLMIKLNTDALDDWAVTPLFTELDALATSPLFPAYRDDLLRGWHDAPLYRDLVVLGGTHAHDNYYHFSICLIPLVRHFPDRPDVLIGMPKECTEREFQRDLLRRTLGNRLIVPLPDPVRVQDPVLVYEPVTAEVVRWLRQHTGVRARRGNRLIYVTRRQSQTGRKGGCVVETDAFASFLARHGFETIDFGDGNTTVDAQVAYLEGARVILSAHGANLTNIAYLDRGTSVIELLPYYWTYFSHMQISCAAGLNHFAIVCNELSIDFNMILRIDQLEEVLAAALVATPEYTNREPPIPDPVHPR